MDASSFAKSYDTNLDTAPFVDKEILYVNDSNNASYSGQIQFDTTVLSNSGRWVDYSEGTLQIPFVISAKSSGDLATGSKMNAYVLGLKNGTHHLIHSMQVEMQNSNVVQLQSFLNFFVGYKVMTSWSSDDLEKWGAASHVAPDSAASMAWSAGTAARGDGTSNNSAYDSAAKTFVATEPIQRSNLGLRTRLENTSHTGTNAYGGIPTMVTEAQCDQVGKSYFTNDGGAAAARIYSWKILATIRLKDLADFFDKIPLVRGVQLRFTINYNSARSLITVAGASSMILTTTTMLSGSTVPYMMSSGAAGQPSVNATDTASTLLISGDVLNTANPAASASSLLSSCRLYVPAYKMSPIAQQRYLDLGTKLVEYNDLYQYTVTAVSAGSAWNQILTNGIVNPQELVIIPVLNSAAGNAATASMIPYQSPFDSCPGTTAPLASISQFNVLISGQTIFQQNEQYDFDSFSNELAREGALMGGVDTGLTSGLLSKLDFDNGYRYYVVDISRRLTSDEVVPVSVQVTGTNNTSKIMDYYCFVTYKRSVEIDLASGAIIRR
jgi:hypothetical protein